jgi:diguanylate cyclase (GGDEF)-like protein/PAS domain S-box-containing protein
MRIDQLSPITGEFILSGAEKAFRAERLHGTIQHARTLFALVAVLNLLYLVSEWRSQDPTLLHLVVAVRFVVVVAALAAFLVVGRASSFAEAEISMLAWAVITCPAIGVLVSLHSNTALFVIMLAPSVCWLLLPASFRLVASAGAYCSVVMLISYAFNESEPFTIVGLGVAMIIVNASLAATVLRSNRLSRLEWAARERERSAKNELAESRDTLQRLLMCVPVPLLIVSKADGRLVHANEAAIEFLGGHPEEIGLRFLSDLRADLSKPVKSLDSTEDAPQRFEGVTRVADGTSRDVLVAARVLKLDGVEHVLVAGLDITDRKLLERRLAHLAATDSLTGLANRAGFFGAVESAVASSSRTDRQPALLMVDMDHFKAINDTYGHETGDAVLRSFAKLCRRLFRSQDIIGRIGGEEFAIVLPETTADAALARAERLRAGAEKLRFRGRATDLRVTASIGIAHVLPGERGIGAALSRADKALYAAKRGGRNRIVVHADDEMGLSKVA